MPPKKNPVNAFFLFAMDWKQKQKRPMSQAEAVNLAGEIWKNMSDQERGPWKTRAKREKMQGRNVDEKYTSTGVPLSLIEREQREKDQNIRMMKKDVETIVKRSFSDNSFAEQKYYFIHVNYFAKTVEGNIYVPAEVALSCYNLKNGVLNTFHSFINPGTTIFGHAYEAKEHADKTHKLPLPPNAMGETEYGKIYKEILNFIKPGESSDQYPPLYTHEEYIPVVLSILDNMVSEPDSEITLKVYSIEYLFYQIGVKTADLSGGKAPDNIHVTTAVFERDVYEHRSGIACDYHEKADASKFCSLSTVVRWGYQFSDNFCHELAITLVPGQHIPIDSDTTMGEKFESKPYLNETDSIISSRTVASTSYQSSLTQLKFEKDAASTVSMASTSQFGRDDFPKLGEKKGSKKSKFDNPSVNDSSDEDSKDINPWAVRAKLNPRQPSEESFSFESIVSGRGRGIAATRSNPTDNTSLKSFGRGSGRGRYFHQE